MREKSIIPKAMLKLLDESGAEWELKACSKHYRLIVNGQVAAHFSLNGGGKSRSRANTLARIKRAIRGDDV